MILHQNLNKRTYFSNMKVRDLRKLLQTFKSDDKVLIWVNYPDEYIDVLTDVESVCRNGKAIQLEVKIDNPKLTEHYH